jgi:cytochrome c-type biogenesis protein CcmH/NrfF
VSGATTIARALAATTLAMSIAPPVAAARDHTSATQVEQQVMCVTCGIPLPEANSPQAEREKAYIRELVGKGLDEKQVKAALVAEYGPAVLDLPKASGVNLAVYVVPPVVVLLALVGLAFAIPRWRRRGRERDPAWSAPARALSDSDAERLDRDLARFDR